MPAKYTRIAGHEMRICIGLARVTRLNHKPGCERFDYSWVRSPVEFLGADRRADVGGGTVRMGAGGCSLQTGPGAALAVPAGGRARTGTSRGCFCKGRSFPIPNLSFGATRWLLSHVSKIQTRVFPPCPGKRKAGPSPPGEGRRTPGPGLPS